MRIKTYAGIGSRDITDRISNIMANVGFNLADHGYTLNSGHADGSDYAFECGCDRIGGNKNIFLPWNGFNGSDSKLYLENMDKELVRKAEEIAKKYHPYWHNLKQGGQKLSIRNSFQVLGEDLETPVDFILCYTKNGKLKGGTAQALRIAEAYNIPVFNMGLYEKDEDLLLNELNKFLKNFIDNN